MARIDLNADLGESFGAWTMGDDDAMLDVVTSANIACGFHGGDPQVMARTIARAKARGVGIGAHPGFDDLRGFGRRAIPVKDPSEIENLVIYQIGAIEAMARAQGATVTHCKIHGALNNMACTDARLAMATAKAVKAAAPHMIYVVLPRSEMEAAGAELGLTLAREIFADRGYGEDGMLIPRGQPGAMIEDPVEAAERMARFVRQGAVESVSGKPIEMAFDTICVHGDSPRAVETARLVRATLEAEGVDVAPMSGALS